MRSFVRFCVVSVALVALAFFCEGLRANFFTEPDTAASVQTSEDRLSDPTRSEHSFIKFNTPCLSSPTAEGQTVTRTVTGASASPMRQARRADLDFRILTLRSFHDAAPQRHSLPTLRKLRL